MFKSSASSDSGAQLRTPLAATTLAETDPQVARVRLVLAGQAHEPGLIPEDNVVQDLLL